MFPCIVIFIFLGIALGVVTGLIPGLHPNTVLVISLTLVPLLSGFPVQVVMVFVASLAITNTFTDFLPSIIFGAPEPTTALSVLPGHQMLLRGQGYQALFLTTVGGLFVSILTCLLIIGFLPLLVVVFSLIYTNIHNYLHFILIFIAGWMVLTEQKRGRLSAVMVFLLSGVFGFITLNTFSSERVLFPALSGLFGLSTLYISLLNRAKVPPQEITDSVQCNYFRGTLTSWLSGLLVGLLPGVGSTQAGIMASQLFRNNIKEFLMTLGGINTANMFFTFLIFYSLGKTRSGAAWTLSQLSGTITVNDFYLISFTCLLASCVSVIITLRLGKAFIGRISSIPYNTLSLLIMLFITAAIAVFTSWQGLLVLFTSTCMGIFTILLGLNRTHLMGFLLFPTIMYFSGMNVILLEILGL